MPNYRFDASYSRFFPDIRDGNGKSLEAKTGMVVAWDSPPSTAEWTQTDEPVTWPVRETLPPGPEKPQEPFPDEPEPEAPVAVAEVPEEPTGPPEPEPVPEPSPESETEQPAHTAGWFSALSSPPARA